MCIATQTNSENADGKALVRPSALDLSLDGALAAACGPYGVCLNGGCAVHVPLGDRLRCVRVLSSCSLSAIATAADAVSDGALPARLGGRRRETFATSVVGAPPCAFEMCRSESGPTGRVNA